MKLAFLVLPVATIAMSSFGAAYADPTRRSLNANELDSLSAGSATTSGDASAFSGARGDNATTSSKANGQASSGLLGDIGLGYSEAKGSGEDGSLSTANAKTGAGDTRTRSGAYATGEESVARAGGLSLSNNLIEFGLGASSAQGSGDGASAGARNQARSGGLTIGAGGTSGGYNNPSAYGFSATVNPLPRN